MKKVYEVSKVLHEKTRYVSEVEATSEEEAIKIAQEQADWEAMDIDLIAEFEPTVELIQELQTLKVSLLVKASDIHNEYVRPKCEKSKKVFAKIAPDNKWNEILRSEVNKIKEKGYVLEVDCINETITL